MLRGMNIFALLVGVAALFIAACAAYFSVRGIALLFGAETEYMWPVIVMASSLEFGKLVAASFLYRHWGTCPRALRNYLCVAVVVLIGITSIGIYGYLSQAFEETVLMVEELEEEIEVIDRDLQDDIKSRKDDLEKEIVLLEDKKKQAEQDILGYRESSRRNFSVKDQTTDEEVVRLETLMESRKEAIEQAEASKEKLGEETARLIESDVTGRKAAEEENAKRVAAEKARLEQTILDRRQDIKQAEARIAALGEETDRLLAADALRRKAAESENAQRMLEEKGRIEKFIAQRRLDIMEVEALKVSAKSETEEVVLAEEDRIKQANERLAALEAVVKVYRDKGPGGFLKNDGIKKANELLKAQAPEREALRLEVSKANENIRNARVTLETRRSSLDERIREIDADIAAANQKITDLTSSSGLAETDNVKVILGNLQTARTGLEKRIQGIETEITEASRKITELTSTSPVYDSGGMKAALENLQAARTSIDERIQGLLKDNDETSREISELKKQASDKGLHSSEDIQTAISNAQENIKLSGQEIIQVRQEYTDEISKKRQVASQETNQRRRKIREIDVGSLQFVARAFTGSGPDAEQVSSSSTWRGSVDSLVKWFILVLVMVFDPLAVTLVIAFNAALLRGGGWFGKGEKLDLAPAAATKAIPRESTSNVTSQSFGGKLKDAWANYGHYSWYALAVLAIVLVVKSLPEGGDEQTAVGKSTDPSDEKAPSNSDKEVGGTAENSAVPRLIHVPKSAFAVCSFNDSRSLLEIGFGKVIFDGLQERVPFLKDVCWKPETLGVDGSARSHYFLKFPSLDWRKGHEKDFVCAMVFPLVDEGRLREELLYRLNLKGADPDWRMVESENSPYVTLRHKREHVAIGFDANRLLLLTSMSNELLDPSFLENELREILSQTGPSWSSDEHFAEAQKKPFDVALWFDSNGFFEQLPKESDDEQFYLEFRKYLGFKFSLAGNAKSGQVDLDGNYFYDSKVLNDKFGTGVVSALGELREGKLSSVLGGHQGQLVEIFAQKLDFKTVCRKLERLDLEKTTGYGSLMNKTFQHEILDESTGRFSFSLRTEDAGGDAMRSCIDLLIDALDPLGETLPPPQASAGGE